MSASLLDSRSFLTATPATSAFTPSRLRVWTGRAVYGLTVALLSLDVWMKVAMTPQAVQGSAQIGFTPQHVMTIGIISLVCLAFYVIPRTRLLGAVLWTGYFGGAVVTHLRLNNPLFTHILSGVYMGILIWGSLYLFDPRVRGMIARVR